MDALWNDALLRASLWPFLAGLAVGGLLVYLMLRSDHVRRRELQREVQRLEAELKAYREQVQQHFRRTSDLFQTLTTSYRSFYEHLATGARSLCREERVVAALDLPEARLLTQDDRASPPKAETAAGVSGAEPPRPGAGAADEPVRVEGDGRAT